MAALVLVRPLKKVQESWKTWKQWKGIEQPDCRKDSLVELKLASHGRWECAAPVVASRRWGVDWVLLGGKIQIGMGCR